MLNALYVSCYVKYKETHYIIVAEYANKIKLLNPLAGNDKLVVLKSNVMACTQYKPAKLVTHLNYKYLVTGSGFIISIRTGRVMQWCATDSNRMAILELAK